MGRIKIKAFKSVVSLLHAWSNVEKVLIRCFLFSHVKQRVIQLYRLEAENAGFVIVHDPDFYIQAANKGLQGFAESYVKGFISVSNIDEVVANIVRDGEFKKDPAFKYRAFLDWLEFEVFEYRSCDDYYNNETDVFESMLGPGMNFSCALWLTPDDDLDSAQRNKMDLIARKLKLEAGMRVLDIGCGYGALAKYLAENHGVYVVGTTSSIDAMKACRRFCKGVPNVEFRLSDCRDIIKNQEKFDRIVAVEVLFHLPKKHYKSFFSNISKCLKEDGLFVMQALGNNDPLSPAVMNLFNNYQTCGALPYITEVASSSAKFFVMEDWANIGAHHEKTLLAWNTNFCQNWERIAEIRGEEFCKMWSFILQAQAAGARTRSVQIWHIVFSKHGVPGGYRYQ